MIKVSALSFCKDQFLREKLSEYFPENLHFRKATKVANEEEMIEFVQGAKGLLIGTEPVTARILKNADHLEIISKYGVGTDNIDFKALEKSGVKFGFTPGVNRLGVAEVALGFALGLTHNLFEKSHALKSGHWQKDGGVYLSKRVIGILGFGNVGQEFARLLSPFSCEVLATDIEDRNQEARELHVKLVTEEELLKRSEILSLHVPLTNLTVNWLNSERISKMKKGSFLINTSRGKVVNQRDLKQALKRQYLRGVALDVFDIEPPTDLELLSLPGLCPTPHIAGNAIEARRSMGLAAISHLREHFLPK